MKLKDILFDENDCIFLCGDSYVNRSLSGIHMASSAGDLTNIPAKSLLFLTHPFFSEEFTPDYFFTLAIRANVSGIALVDFSDFTLSEKQRWELSAHSVFVLALPPAASYYSIIYQMQDIPWPIYSSALFQCFRSELAALCAHPYTALDVAMLLNRTLSRPVDLIVGPELNCMTQHDTLGVTNVAAVLARNLNKILASQAPQICYNRNSRALFLHIMDLYAFYAVPLGDGRSISELEIAILQESLPYIALPLSQPSPSCRLHSLESFYLGILRGTLTMDTLSLRETASLLGIKSDLPRYVWILEWQDPIQAAVQQAFAEKAAARFPASFIHVQESRLVVITPAAQLRPGDQPPAAALREFLSDCWRDFPAVSLRISFSKVCASLKHLKNAFTEAKFSMIIGPKLNPKKHLHDYQSYILYQILCNSWGLPVLKYIHQSIITPLRQYDEEASQSLLATLEQFASCAFNITRTAEALQVHRNTLYRRIAKIGAILQRDMSSTDTHILLYIALRIDHITRIFPQTEKNLSWTL